MGARYFQTQTKINYNFSLSVLEFCVNYSLKKVFLPPQAIGMNLLPLLQYSHLTRWEATHAGQGGSHLLVLRCSCSLGREQTTCIYALSSRPTFLPVCIKYINYLDTDDLLGRLIWVQTDAESRASKARIHKAYVYDYEWKSGKCFLGFFSPLKKGHCHILHF